MSQDSNQAQQPVHNDHAPHNIIEIIKKNRKAYEHPTEGDLLASLEHAELSNLDAANIYDMDFPRIKVLVYAMALQIDVLRDLLSGVLEREEQATRQMSAMSTADAWGEIGLRALDAERMLAHHALQQENRLLKSTLMQMVEDLGLDQRKFSQLLYPQAPENQSEQEESQPAAVSPEQSTGEKL